MSEIPVIPLSPEAPLEQQLARFSWPQIKAGFCRFDAMGTILRTPEYRGTRTGATAAFNMTTTQARDLEILVSGKDIPGLQRRLREAVVGALVVVHGHVKAPKTGSREPVLFIADPDRITFPINVPASQVRHNRPPQPVRGKAAPAAPTPVTAPNETREAA